MGSLDAFSTAESSLGERQVHGHIEHHGVVEVGRTFVEFAHARGADTGIEGREDVQQESDSEISDRSVLTSVKSGACEPTAGMSPTVFTALPLNCVVTMSLL